MHEEDERFVLECIENKATAHGCRHDPVLYLNHRVKKRDFLKLVNYNRARRGLKQLKSATTVYNRARPRNIRSIQAKNHLGMGLFCSKKPPKLQENDNILTHHQHAFKKNILLREYHESNGEGLKFNLFLSRDDKAYICPGTGTGTVHLIIRYCGSAGCGCSLTTANSHTTLQTPFYIYITLEAIHRFNFFLNLHFSFTS
jgi:hypothetical protein